MSRFSARRLPFNPAGPFIARKAVRVLGIDFSEQSVCTADELAPLGPRRLELLWETRRIDVASPEDIAAWEAAGSPPMGRHVPEGGEAAPAPLEGATPSLEHVRFNLCMDCPDTEGCAAAGACSVLKVKEANAAITISADGILSGQGGGGDPPAALAEPGKPVAVYNEGFGRWFAADANGAKVGKKMTKAQAEAMALPVIPRPTPAT